MAQEKDALQNFEIKFLHQSSLAETSETPTCVELTDALIAILLLPSGEESFNALRG